MRSNRTSAQASGSATPASEQKRIFLPKKTPVQLGSGGEGQVQVVADVSTGIEYAGKTFTKDIYYLREKEAMVNLEHVSNLRA